MELAKYWEKSDDPDHRGEYWLSVRYRRGKEAPHRAYISWVNNGERTLFLWDERSFEPHLTSDNLRLLKTIGRMEAVRRLNV